MRSRHVQKKQPPHPTPAKKNTPQKLNFSDFFFRFNLKKNSLWVLHGPCISSNMWVVFWKLSGFHLSLKKKPSPYSAGSQRTSLIFWEKKSFGLGVLQQPDTVGGHSARPEAFAGVKLEIIMFLSTHTSVSSTKTEMEEVWGRGLKKDPDYFDRKFNVASHMGHIRSVFYSFLLCVCVSFKVRLPVHLKVCKADDMCSHHKVCVYLCFIFFSWGGRREARAFREGGVCVCVSV